ncbi:MFS transporter permease [Lactobacillus taiwanensis]|uniref:MFS transporter permease n=1 Tax=Lactobacillus taiwanensis TaxID=508451 RepID=UPI000EDF7B3F|nr:MFS transporter permease [Lactobacillus taiwanensis]MRM97775.1 MFS transporter permease [Lactobacillus taiwanensis]
MTNILKVEFLKNKHTIIHLLIWLLPLIAILMMTAVFWDNQYSVQLMMGQWSYFWLNMSIALVIGISTYYQNQATKFKEILTSPQDLFTYEVGRIIHGILQAALMSVIFLALVICVRFIFSSSEEIVWMLCSGIGIFLTSIWLVPFYSWLFRVTNLYFALGIGFLSSILAMFLSRTSWSMWWPFDWGMLLNNMWLKGDFVLGSWSLIICSLILGFILSVFSAYSFKKQ